MHRLVLWISVSQAWSSIHALLVPPLVLPPLAWALSGFSIFEPGFFGTSSWLSLAWADCTCLCPHISEPYSLCEGHLHPPSHQVGNFQAIWDICLLFPTACHQAHSPSNNSGVHPFLSIPPGWWLSSVLIPTHLDFLASGVSSQQGQRKRWIGVGESVGLFSDPSSSP